jgi:methyl-accepting chemotaxis protein WspA
VGERQLLHHLLRRLRPRRPHAGLPQRRPPDLAGAGRERLGGTGRARRQLVGSAGSISAKLATIREKADNITQAVTTTQVAGQADLLSTNAASEAEKAGEHG